MEEYNLSLTELDETQNHDDFRVVWLSSSDMPKSLIKFADYLEKFSSMEACISYIHEVQSERKILLVLLMNLECLSNFEDLSQIHSIYALTQQHETSQLDKQDYSKLVGPFENLYELINRLRKDILLTYTNDLSINISSLYENKIDQTLTNLSGNSLTIFCYRYLISHLIEQRNNMNMDELKQIMLNQCRLEYKNFPNELFRIHCFDKSCSNDTILNWYTKDSFLYRLLNKAFRTRNISYMCKFLYIFIGLYNKFEELTIKQKEIGPLTVYRGQVLNPNDLKRLQSNIEPLISTNTFMSTSRHEQTARAFIIGAPLSALFKIHIPHITNERFRPFIDISSFSSMPHENEILFFVGTIFRIDSIQQEDTSTWIVELTLDSEIVEHIENLIDDFQKHMPIFKNNHSLFMKTDDFRLILRYYYLLTNERFISNNSCLNMMYIYIAFIFSNLGCFQKAIDIYKTYLRISHISIDNSKSVVIHMIIGYLYYHLSRYEDAFLFYGIVLSLLDETNLLTIELYNHIGDVWNNINNIEHAVSCYQHALHIAEINKISKPELDQKIHDLANQNSTNENSLTTDQSFDRLYETGIQLMRKGDFLQAYEVFVKTRQMLIEEKFDDENNPTKIQSIDLLYQIGLCLMKKGDFSQALTSLLNAEKIIIKHPPLWHRFPQLLATLYDNITLLYFFLNQPLKAFIMWKKSNDVKTNFSYN
ncbi:hypothetical protein I4U23_004317 [Adineta vaga]|nr:hypothetical protein I4U23_004317 [Adineta vaga]